MHIEKRIRLLSFGFVLAVLVISGRLFFWQIVKGEDLAVQGRLQQKNSSQIHASRGDILASDGSWLAVSVDAWRLYAERPEFSGSPSEVAIKLAEIFADSIEFEDDEDEPTASNEDITDKPVEVLKKTAKEKREEYFDFEKLRLESLLGNEKLVYIPLKNKVSRQVREKIEDLNINGLKFEDQEDRFYPEASAASHVLGFVGKDENGADKGYFGLEGYYDISLTGRAGFKSRETNAFGAPIIFGESKESVALQGVDLITYIDKTVQLYIEKGLAKGVEKYGAKSGNIIVIRPSDGAIIAMASYPSFDPRKYSQYTDELFRNPVISDGFEPGSIFKPLVMAAGIDAGVVTPETVCDVCDRPYKVDKYFIRTWNNEYRPGSNMTDVIVHSDNVGMAFVGSRLGQEKLYDYLSGFGFGTITGIDLQGEVAPVLRGKGSWNIVDTATTTFGQGIAVTPIQMAKALSAIANGGRIVTPHLVHKIKMGDAEENITIESGRQIISRETAAKVTEMMVQAVKNGEAKWAVPQGFTIAGKTGTAQIPVEGHYDDEKTIASFVGFAPPRDPKFLMLITLREPESSPWASETAAPLWFDIAKDIFPYLGIQPNN